MVPISMDGIGQIWLNSLCAMSSVKVFAMQDGWPIGWPHKHNSLHIYLYNTHMDHKYDFGEKTELFSTSPLASKFGDYKSGATNKFRKNLDSI